MTTENPKLQKKTLKLIEEINLIIREIPVKLTLRQIWYQIVSKKIMVNNPLNYQTISRDATKGRRYGLIPVDAIIDPERHQDIKDYFFTKPEEFYKYKTSYKALKDYLTNYFVHKWHKQPQYIEVWSEKGALRTLFEPITKKYGVSFVVTKGYSSYTLLLESAKRIKEECEERKVSGCTILFFGDYDPSGKDIMRACGKDLTILDNKTDTSITLKDIALTEQQINDFELSLIPLKKTDKRYPWFMQNYGAFGSKGCELDSLNAKVLQNIIEKTILDHYNLEIFEQVEAQRQEEISKMVLEAEKLLSKMDVKK